MRVTLLGPNCAEVEYAWLGNGAYYDYACACGAVHRVFIDRRVGKLDTHTFVGYCTLVEPALAIIQALLCT